MVSNVMYLLRASQVALQALALYAIAALAALLIGATLLATLGLIPWPELPVRFDGAPLPNAGVYAQIGLTLLATLLCFFLPSNARMAKLERSHRSFQLSMDDVKRAYELAHAADRKGVFALSTEFEQMRQRMDLLRKHPDLAQLEPELLEVAAQMSFESRDLARAYSEDRVTRARGFLKSRQQEIDLMKDRIQLARMTCDELRRWLHDIQAEERLAQDQIRRLEADLRDVLPGLGYDFDEARDANVVSLPKSGQTTPH